MKVYFSCQCCAGEFTRDSWAVAQAERRGYAIRFCSKTCTKEGQQGHFSPGWKGGVSITTEGYRQLHVPDHPHADSRGYVMEHRVVVERKIGRFLRPEEQVHHKDEDRLNNDPDNLELMADNAAHRATHAEYQTSACPNCGNLVQSSKSHRVRYRAKFCSRTCIAAYNLAERM